MMRESRGHDSDADFSAILARWARNQYGYIAKIFRLTSQTADRQLTDSKFRVTSWRACTCATAGLRPLRLVPECINALRDLPHLASCFRHCCSRHCQWIFPLFLLPFGTASGSGGPTGVGIGSQTSKVPGSRCGEPFSAAWRCTMG